MSNYILSNGNVYGENELTHYGVVGMKWGVRRLKRAERVNLRRAANALTDNRKEKFKQQAEKRKNQADELQKELDAMSPADIKAARKRTAKTLGKIGLISATAIATAPIAMVGASICAEFWKGVGDVIRVTGSVAKEVFKK